VDINDLLDSLLYKEKKVTKQKETLSVDLKIPTLDPIQSLRKSAIEKQVERLLKAWPTKNLFAVTELTGCVFQTYLRLSGEVKEHEIDKDKLFYLLDIYGRMGDAVHNYIYSLNVFKDKEISFKDNTNHINGRIDGLTYDGTVWELKSGKVSGSEIKQIALQYHLTKVNNFPVKEFKVWWVIKQKIAMYPKEELDTYIPDLLHKSNKLFESLHTQVAPVELIDESECNYCAIKTTCYRVRKKK